MTVVEKNIMTLLFPNLILLFFKILIVKALFPPPYSVDLKDSGVFDVSDLMEGDELEDEIIKRDSFSQIFSKNEGKFFQIHHWANKTNYKYMKQLEYSQTNNENTINKVFEESYPDKDEPIPYEGGFVNENNDFKQPVDNEKVYYLNEMAKSLIYQKIDETRSKKNKHGVDTNDNENIDYGKLEAEYNKEINEVKSRNDTLNLTNVEEDESVKESFADIIGFNSTKNCTEEERTGIGLNAIKCIYADVHDKRAPPFKRIGRIILIWFCVYLAIAIPCFCQKGWCCCCFYCCCQLCCRPREVITEAQYFFANNPIGVYNLDGETYTYTPTHYEKYSQKKLEKAIMKI